MSRGDVLGGASTGLNLNPSIKEPKFARKLAATRMGEVFEICPSHISRLHTGGEMGSRCVWLTALYSRTQNVEGTSQNKLNGCLLALRQSRNWEPRSRLVGRYVCAGRNK